MKQENYTFEEFVEVIRQLRGEGGCPWDQEQTHESLKKCLEDETRELLEGIDIYNRTGDWDNLCEELGDVLLQVVMHSVIASEERIFTMDDVVDGITRKMIRRHPHVFGEHRGEPPLSWEELKRMEKEQKASDMR